MNAHSETAKAMIKAVDSTKLEHCGIAEALETGFVCEADIQADLHKLCDIIGFNVALDLLGNIFSDEAEHGDIWNESQWEIGRDIAKALWEACDKAKSLNLTQ